jgi:hypothetical protein
VGHVGPVDPLPVQRCDSAPGGVHARDVGLARERAVRRAVQRAAPQARTHPAERAADLVLLTGDVSPASEAAELVRAGSPHLVVGIVETTGVVGPLVLPGRTACVRCLDLHRSDRDPAWPRLLAQLAAPASTAACDVVLASSVATTAAQQALALLDAPGGVLPAAANGTLELAGPGWRYRRRSWPPHPACGCGWQQSVGDDTMAG